MACGLGFQYSASSIKKYHLRWTTFWLYLNSTDIWVGGENKKVGGAVDVD